MENKIVQKITTITGKKHPRPGEKREHEVIFNNGTFRAEQEDHHGATVHTVKQPNGVHGVIVMKNKQVIATNHFNMQKDEALQLGAHLVKNGFVGAKNIHLGGDEVHKVDHATGTSKSVVKESAEESADDLDEAKKDSFGYPSHTTQQVMKKIKDGHWEAQSDVKPGHLEVRHTATGKRQMIHVRESVEESADDLDEGITDSPDYSGVLGDVKRTGKSHTQLAAEHRAYAKRMHSIGQHGLAANAEFNAKNHEQAAKELGEAIKPYSDKAPRKNSLAYKIMQNRKKYDQQNPPVEPSDQMVGTAKIIKKIEEGNIKQKFIDSDRAEATADPYKNATPTSGVHAARNDHKQNKTSNNPWHPRFHKQERVKWDSDYENEMNRLSKKTNESEEIQMDNSIEEGKFLETHLSSGKPNPNHPAFAKHKAAYDAAKAALKSPRAARAPEENPIKMHHIDAAISNSFPDVEPYEHLARKFPHLHKAPGKNGSKLTDLADKTIRANDKKHKTLSSYCDAAYKEMHDDNMMGESEAVDEAGNVGTVNHKPINLYHKKGGYIGTTKASPTKEHAIATAERTYKLSPGSVVAKFDRPVKESEELDEGYNDTDAVFLTPQTGPLAAMRYNTFKEGSVADHKKAIKYHTKDADRASKQNAAFHDMRAKLHKDYLASINEEVFDELDEENFPAGKVVYTTHTDKPLRGISLGKDDDNKDCFIIKHKDGNHSVHHTNIHPSMSIAKMMTEELDESGNQTPTVHSEKYSWGTMKHIKVGKSFSIPLHPKHHEAIEKLADQGEHRFTDETNARWNVKRDGDMLHFTGNGSARGNNTKVPLSYLKSKNESEDLEEQAKYRRDDLEGKAHKTWIDDDGSEHKEALDGPESGDELNRRPGAYSGRNQKRMTKQGIPTKSELRSQATTKALMKYAPVTGPKGRLPESEELEEMDFGSMANTLSKYGKGVKDEKPGKPKRLFTAPDYTMTGHKEKETKTGHVYTKVFDDDDDSAKAAKVVKSAEVAAAPKRGRGRPAGAVNVDKSYRPWTPEAKASMKAKLAARKAAKAEKNESLTDEDWADILEGADINCLVEVLMEEGQLEEAADHGGVFKVGDVVSVDYHDISGKSHHGKANVDKATKGYVHVKHPSMENHMMKFHQTVNGKNTANEVGTLPGTRAGGYKITKLSESESLEELSNDTLTNYKVKSLAQAMKADREGNPKKGDKRFAGIVKATNKQFDNDEKKAKAKKNESANEIIPDPIHKMMPESTETDVVNTTPMTESEKRMAYFASKLTDNLIKE